MNEEINSSISIDWDDLYEDLKNQRTVLILGPDFYNVNDISPKEMLYNELASKPDHGILHFYSNNGIFLFQSQFYKNRAQKSAAKFFNNLDSDEIILEQISQLPFKIIINTSPDKILQNYFKKSGIAYQSDYFTWAAKRAQEEIVEPDKNFPLVYNLFGSIESFESIVLDFEDLYDHLTALLKNVAINEEIKQVLSNTDSYIFIGFHLERWDTQLLFRYLNMKKHGFDDSKKNYTTRSTNIDNNFESFFRKQFNLKYYGGTTEFLTEMHTLYRQKENELDEEDLRKNTKDVVRAYISEGELEKALRYLFIKIDDSDIDMKDHITALRGEFSNYIQKQRQRSESFETLQLMRAKILEKVLFIIESI